MPVILRAFLIQVVSFSSPSLHYYPALQERVIMEKVISQSVISYLEQTTPIAHFGNKVICFRAPISL